MRRGATVPDSMRAKANLKRLQAHMQTLLEDAERLELVSPKVSAIYLKEFERLEARESKLLAEVRGASK